MKIPTKTTFLLLLPLLVISCGNEKPSPNSNQLTLPHIHAPSSTYVKDETGHYHPCTCESDVRFDFAPHNYVKNSEGIQVCTTCGYLENEEKEAAWKIMKASLLNSLQYDGPLTASVAMEGEEEGAMVKNAETFSADPVTGKFVQTSKTEVLDPTTSQWMSAPEGKKKVEIDEDDFTLYEFDGSEVTATNVDKEYAIYDSGTNPWDLFGGSFRGSPNSLSSILSKMDSFAEIREYLPLFLKMDGNLGIHFDADIEVKEDTYCLILKGSSFAQDPEYGKMGTESSGSYTITFDKNTFLSLGVDVYGKSENLNEEKNEKSVQSMAYSFAYSFDDTLYESTTFDEKPTPSGYASGKIDLEFEGGYLWKGAFRKNINHTVNEIAAPNGLELFYDAKMKKPVSDDEMFSTIGKKYYARPKILTDRSFVVTMVEVDYKAPTKMEKFITGYVDRYVTDYALYSGNATHTIYSFPTKNQVEYLNATITVNGATVTSNTLSVVPGNLYTVLIKMDGVATPLG